MKVLQILDNICIDSGVSSIIMDIYRNIDKKKIQFDFLVCRKEENMNNSYHDEIKSYGGEIIYVGEIMSIKRHISARKNIHNFFQKNAYKYDAIHLHVPTISYFVLKSAKKYGIQNRIIHSHSSMTSANKLKAIINKYLMQGKKYANVFWTCSDNATKFLYGERFANSGNVKFIRNAVSSDKFCFDNELRIKMRNDLGIGNEKLCVHISNFSPIKNVHFLLPIIRQVIEKDNGIKFLFVGDGPTKEDFRNKIKENNLEKSTIFIGRVKGVYEYLCAADVLLLPSIKEGLPVVVIEAQACGLPCFISNTVTTQADVGMSEFLQLEDNLWADRIIEFEQYSVSQRNKLSLSFINSPYDINSEIKSIEKMYLDLLS